MPEGHPWLSIAGTALILSRLFQLPVRSSRGSHGLQLEGMVIQEEPRSEAVGKISARGCVLAVLWIPGKPCALEEWLSK